VTEFARQALALAKMFRDPASDMLFHGFDSLKTQAPDAAVEWWCAWQPDLAYDNLVHIAEAVGSLRLEYPEASACSTA
jgi:hypothetical protein